MELQPEGLLLAQLVGVAIRDARQAKNESVRAGVGRWLWENAPGIAERAGVAPVDRFMNKFERW